MPLQHYLPATFVAHFSSQKTLPRRERLLAAGDLIAGRSFSARASGLAGENDLYTLTASQMDPLLVDKSLTGYEANLSNAIEQLIQRNITAMAWASTLVPFVSGLMVRGPDFNVRFDARIAQLGIEVPPDNTNDARFMEFQRLLAPVAAAQWIVLDCDPDLPLITSDIAHAPFLNPTLRHFGMAIPLDLSHILVLVPHPRRTLAVALGGDWLPIIDYFSSPGRNHTELCRVLAARARRFIFGPDTAVIDSYLRERATTVPPLEPGQMGFIDDYFAMIHDLDWHRLITVLSQPPNRDRDSITMDLLSLPR